MSEPVVAIIVAAGLGLRYGGSTPKAMLKVTGRALIAMSVEAMAAGGCTHAVVVVHPALAEKFEGLLSGSPIPVITTHGGATRQESAHRGLKRMKADPVLSRAAYVLIHDAVRPMVPAHVVESVIVALRNGAEAVAPALLVTDSMRMVGDDRTMVIDRNTLRAVQTPQGFRFDVIWESHEKMARGEGTFTDDVSCAESAGHHVTLVEGSKLAMKITEPTDLTVARALWRVRATIGHHSGRRLLRLWER